MTPSPSHRRRALLGVALTNAIALALAATLAVLRFRWVGFASLYDGFLLLLAAVLLGQVSVAVLVFSLLEPRSVHRWRSALLFAAALSATCVTSLRAAETRPWIWLEEIARLLPAFFTGFAGLVAVFLCARVAWWPVQQMSLCRIEFDDQPAAMSKSAYSIGDLLLWTTAVAGVCALLVALRVAPILAIVFAACLTIASTLPVAVVAMLAGLSSSLRNILLLCATIVVVSAVEMVALPRLIGQAGFTWWAALAFNFSFAALVFANFNWQARQGMRMTGCGRLFTDAE